MTQALPKELVPILPYLPMGSTHDVEQAMAEEGMHGVTALVYSLGHGLVVQNAGEDDKAVAARKQGHRLMTWAQNYRLAHPFNLVVRGRLER